MSQTYSFPIELKTYNEKLNNCGSDYKKNDNSLTILVEQKLPSCFDMFIQTRNKSIEISEVTLRATFEDFVKF